MKAPCAIFTEAMKKATQDGWPSGCPELAFEEGRHWCGVLKSMKTAKSRNLVKGVLSIGEGCCSGLNSWRREPIKDRRSGQSYSSDSSKR